MSTLSRRVFVKQVGMGAAAVGILSSLPTQAWNSRSASLPRSAPEAQGIMSADIIRFLDVVTSSKIEFHSIMIVRHGFVVAEGWWTPYSKNLRHKLYSVSKSFTSSAVGFAVAEGKLSVDDTVISFFPSEKPKEVSANLAAMKLRHLLTMTSGHAKDTIPALRGSASAASWAQLFLNLPVDFEPGTHFVYNTGATYMLSAIVQKVTGQSVHDYLRPRLFDPLGITGEDWETDPQGITTGGYGLRIKTEDIAKLGLLYLQKGKWNGQQLLPEQWVAEATRAQVPSTPANFSGGPLPDGDWTQGYGYQFWRNQPMGFRADGAFGQFSLVLPEKDAVIAITAESFDLQGSMKLVWNNLLPAMKDIFVAKDNRANEELKKALNKLSLEPNRQNATSTLASKISGKEFKLDANNFNASAFSLSFTKETCVFKLTTDAKIPALTAGINQWIESKDKPEVPPFAIKGRTDVTSKIAASVTWADEKTLVLTRRMIETPHGDELEFTFDGDRVIIKFMNSISANNPSIPEERPDLTGRLG